MTRAPLPFAAVPAEAWTHIRRLKEIAIEREKLSSTLPPAGRGERAVFRRLRMRELTHEALRCSNRLAALNVTAGAVDLPPTVPPRQYRED